jgi:hypothetical protein
MYCVSANFAKMIKTVAIQTTCYMYLSSNRLEKKDSQFYVDLLKSRTCFLIVILEVYVSAHLIVNTYKLSPKRGLNYAMVAGL